MRIVSSAWIPGSLSDFEAQCCLGTHAAHGLATADHPFDIFILDGFERLTPDFVGPLQDRHIRLHDAGEATREVLALYGGLPDLLNPGQGVTYEVYCFIRWLVLEKILAGDPFVHIDLDLFFQVPLAQAAVLFTGKSGTFGSPCLTSVGTPDWLSAYRDGLDALVADRTGFQASVNYQGNEYRQDISSDQDLVIVLQNTGALPKHGLDDLNDAFQIFVNPLWPYPNYPAAPLTWERRDGRDHIGGKPVLFWHLQNNFSDYVSRFAVLDTFKTTWMAPFLPVRLGLPFIQLAPSAENFAFQALRDMAWSQIGRTLAEAGDPAGLGPLRYFARTWVADWFVLQGEGRGLFSKDYWWQDGVFS